MSPKVILLAGPTACGKTHLAVEIAKRVNGIIINADSMQIYKELHILSARPTNDEMQGIPHVLFGEVSAREAFSVADWHERAMAAVNDALQKGQRPILVGGTGLYFKSLLDGLAIVPEIDIELRDEIRIALLRFGSESLYVQLQDEDPVMAERLSPNDGQRIARALEVIRYTGKSLADYQKDTQLGGLAAMDKRGEVLKLVLDSPREKLYERINSRFLEMVEEGALDEVKNLLSKDLSPDAMAMKALGVPSFAAYINGDITLDEAITDAQKQSRHYAKRQLTWMRNQFPKWLRVMGGIEKDLTSFERLLGVLKLN